MSAPPPRKAAASTRIPANAPRPQDRKPKQARTTAQKNAAVAAAKAEAEDGYVSIESCGMTLKLPVGGKVPIEAILVVQKDAQTLEELNILPENAELVGVRMLLGPEQWKKYRTKNPTADDFAEIGNQLEALQGN